ncbi:MAG: AAA-like domain-containing protein [Limnospira sp.]
MQFEYPGGPVPLDSPFYIFRPPIEERIYQEIEKPGSVIRIRAPRKMGKSSLLYRILARAQQGGYFTVSIDLTRADVEVLSDLNRFLRWFCATVCHHLHLSSQLDDYWDEDIGSKISCTIYFQDYILTQLDRPLFLALNEVNHLFEYPRVATEFLPLLRSWYEEARQVEVLQKMRLAIVHSTEIYVPLKLNQSPFNIGLPIRLPSFTAEQVEDLARRHGLGGNIEDLVPQLMEMVGGHPYLVRLALYELVNSWGGTTGDLSDRLRDIFDTATTQAGIYNQHLCELLAILEDQPELLDGLETVVMAEGGTQIEPIVAYKLESLGLVKLTGNKATVGCELYRQYFKSLCEGGILKGRSRIQQLEEMNRELQKMANVDELTQVANRRFFASYLRTQWQQHGLQGEVLSLILCDIDHFKSYNDTYGHIAGDRCLQLVAKALRSSVGRSADVVARYGGEEFAIILPQTTPLGARHLAETICKNVKALQIIHKTSFSTEKIVTISVGVVSIIPNLSLDPSVLIGASDEALYESKSRGRDRVTAKDWTIAPFESKF